MFISFVMIDGWLIKKETSSVGLNRNGMQFRIASFYRKNSLKRCQRKSSDLNNCESMGYFDDLVVVNYWYLIPFVSSYPVLIRWRLLVCEGCKERKRMRRIEEISLNFNFIIFGFSHDYSLARNVFTNQALTFSSRFGDW